MTPKEIETLAFKTGIGCAIDECGRWVELSAFTKEVINQEREACALLCISMADDTLGNIGGGAMLRLR
jgi:hypothetical protein